MAGVGEAAGNAIAAGAPAKATKPDGLVEATESPVDKSDIVFGATAVLLGAAGLVANRGATPLMVVLAERQADHSVSFFLTTIAMPPATVH